MANKYYQIRVRGKGEFPLDMLRYSQCWPCFAQDVANLTGDDMTERDKYLTPRSVNIGLIGNDVTATQCIERFKSFNWNAEIISENKV